MSDHSAAREQGSATKLNRLVTWIVIGLPVLGTLILVFLMLAILLQLKWVNGWTPVILLYFASSCIIVGAVGGLLLASLRSNSKWLLVPGASLGILALALVFVLAFARAIG